MAGLHAGRQPNSNPKPIWLYVFFFFLSSYLNLHLSADYATISKFSGNIIELGITGVREKCPAVPYPVVGMILREILAVKVAP